MFSKCGEKYENGQKLDKDQGICDVDEDGYFSSGDFNRLFALGTYRES